MVSTDHCPFCMKEQKELGIGRLPGHPTGSSREFSQQRDLMYQGVVHRADLAVSLGRADLYHAGTDVRALTARKGVIQPGADADLVIYYLQRPHLYRRWKDPPHEHGLLGLGGLRDRRPRGLGDVPRRGGLDETGYVGTKGHGKFLRRGLSQYLMKARTCGG